MRALALTAIALVLSTQAQSAETRQLSAHEHGVGALNIAVEGNEILMELEVPGADIVGFEHEAESAEDRAKIDAAIAILAKPLELFVLPAAAKCTVTGATAALIGDEDHDDHDHDGHAKDDDHDHDEHAKDDDHDHDEHAKDDDHDHDEAHKEGHDEDHADHADHGEEHHTEFHAEYGLNCAAPEAIDKIDFAYFAQFPNARELVVQMISGKGSNGFEVERDKPTLSLNGAI
ncbi:MAG: DUF2796 domain-containing protein [Pseudomonadota bacterium]